MCMGVQSLPRGESTRCHFCEALNEQGWVQEAGVPSMAVCDQCPPLSNPSFPFTFPAGKGHRYPAHSWNAGTRDVR